MRVTNNAIKNRSGRAIIDHLAKDLLVQDILRGPAGDEVKKTVIMREYVGNDVFIL